MKGLFLAPGRLLAKSVNKDKKRNYRSVRHRAPGGPGVIFISLVFWFLLLAGLMLAVDKSGLLKEVLDAGVEVAQGGGALETPESGEAASGGPAEGSPENNGAASAPSSTPAAPDSPSMSGNLQNPGSGPITAPPAAPAGSPTETVEAERWLVILHTIPRNARGEAERRQSQYASRGLSVEIMDTDAFPRLVGGSWIIAQGPFDSRAQALEAANRAKEFNSDLMVRRGL